MQEFDETEKIPSWAQTKHQGLAFGLDPENSCSDSMIFI